MYSHSLQARALASGGAGMNSFSGLRLRISWITPLSVATMKRVLSDRMVYFSSAAVEPTKSDTATTASLHSGWVITAASGYCRFSSRILAGENCSCTWQAPFHSSISRPVMLLM